VAIDKNQRKPVYRQICEFYLEKIRNGELTDGDPIPSENELKDLYGISRMTARAALRELENLGVVECFRGKGRQICTGSQLTQHVDFGKNELPVAVFPIYAGLIDATCYNSCVINGLNSGFLKNHLSSRFFDVQELQCFSCAFEEYFNSSRFCGLIWINSNLPAAMTTLSRLQYLDIPYVVLNHTLPAKVGAYVVTDHFKGAFQLTEHLLKMGHRNIAILSAEMSFEYAQLRWEGAKAAIRRAGLTPDPSQLFTITDWNNVEATVDRILELNRYTAILIAGGSFAPPTLARLAEKKISVPEQISIVVFDKIVMNVPGIPSLTCVSQPFEELGIAAVDMLLREITAPGTNESLMIQPQFLVGGSCRQLIGK